MPQNTIKESPNTYIFLAMVFIILSIILIVIELQEHYQFFSSQEAQAPTSVHTPPTK